MNVLSEEKILEISEQVVCTNDLALGYSIALARAIEAAVLEAQGKQEPVAWVKYGVGVSPHFVPVVNGAVTFSCSVTESLEYDPLYAGPVVQPDMVMVPREPMEEWLESVVRVHQPHLQKGCKAWLKCERQALYWHAAMIAAAKGKP